MGLNAKDIQLRLFRVVRASAESSYTFLQRHPLVSSVLLVCFIIYILLSYIYTFLNYVSPFLVCAAIFLRIFWSSEQTHLKYVKREEEKGEKKSEKVEPKHPKIPPNNIGRPELLYKYPSQNATSRRRNFRDKKWDVYGGLEEKAKDLSTVFQNEFTKRNMESFERGEGSLDYGLFAKKNQVLRRQTLRTEPSMIDLVECGDAEIEAEKTEDGEDEEEEDAQQEDRNKAILEWTENDQKNLMDLGISEVERNKRLESLMARRRARRLLKLQLENGLNDKKTIRSMAPLLITKGNPFDSSKDYDGLEMPGSAPSVMPRSPYDIPYDPSEEKPNLTGDSFLQEYACHHHKDMPFCRHESFSLGPFYSSETKQDHGAREPYSINWRKYSERPAYSRFRKHPDKGNHDWLIDQLIYNEGGENGFQEPNPIRKGEEETSNEDQDGKCKGDMADMKSEKVLEIDHETKSISDQANKPSLVPNISNVETVDVSEKPGPRFSKPHERLLSLPVSATDNTTSTTLNESMYDHVPSPVDKRQESMFLTDRRLCHTPTYSIASDLQVEVSEVGSPTSTIDENAESTNSSIDRDSVLYDGDIDRDVSSGSEDLWGTSFHGRDQARSGVRSDEDTAEEEVNNNNNNSKDIVSPISLRQIDEENAADVSSMSSNPDMPEDTPTCAINTDNNIFGSVGEETEMPQSSNSSYVSSPQKRLMGSSVEDQLPNETHSEKLEECANPSENLSNESRVINDVNNSTTTEQDNTENSISNEDPAGHSTSVARQESIDEAYIYSISSSSPRSVLPDKTTADEVSSSAFNQQMDIGPQQSNMEDVAQETLNGEHPPDTMPQNIQPLMDDVTGESHNVDHFNPSQEQTSPPENSIEESNIFDNVNDGEVYNKKEQDKLNNDEENSEDNSTHQISQEATLESTRQINEMTIMDDIDEKSRDSVDDKVPLSVLVEDDKHEIAASGNIHEEFPQPRDVSEPIVPDKEANESHEKDS